MASLTNKEVLFASLLGSKVVETIPRLSALENQLETRVLPVLPYPITSNTSNIQTQTSSVREVEINPKRPEAQQFFPLSFSLTENGQRFLLPYEPMLSISGKNTIIKRTVAKSEGLKGSIKERWSQDDYEVTITGILLGEQEFGKVEDCFPKKDFKELLNILTYAGSVYVYCEPLALLDIKRLVIESYSFPFTKGENVQAYEIKCLSDSSYKLLLEV